MESLTLSCRSFQFAGTFFLSFRSVYLKTSYEKIKIKNKKKGKQVVQVSVNYKRSTVK